MHSSFPKLQLIAEQALTGECWISPQKDTPHPRAMEKAQQDGRRGDFAFKIKPHSRKRRSEGSNIPCAHQRVPTETKPELCLSVSCGGMDQQWPAAGAGALGAADLGMA